MPHPPLPPPSKIKEVIVVEGKDDINAVRRAVDAELIATGGFGFTDATIERIREAQRRCGVIILTDPDHAGEQIRRRVAALIGPCKHAHLDPAACTRPDDGDIGVENASPACIRQALARAHCERVSPRQVFTPLDLVHHRLTGAADASRRRARLGVLLGVGAASARRLLQRLNHYGITREAFTDAVARLDA